VTLHDPVLRACSQAGLVNNLNDALAWGLAPLYLAAHGASAREIAAVAAVYPAVWGLGQLGTGWLSDHVGRKPLIALGMLVQGGGLALLVAGGGVFGPALAAAVLLGVGTAMVYPTLIAAVSDAVEPRDRAQAVGVYRFWRDAGFVAGGLAAGVVADTVGNDGAIGLVAALTAASGILVAATPWHARAEAAALPIGLDSSRRLLQDPLMAVGPRRTAEELYAAACASITRYDARDAHAAAERGALIVDIRSQDNRRRGGIVPGSLHIPRTVLEWRVDPDSGWCNPFVGGCERQLILLCDHGYSSALAAAALVELGFERAGDVIDGFVGWREAGLPVGEAPPPPDGPQGMGAPDAA
jgi:rhodanese-related sulfurtransferase